MARVEGARVERRLHAPVGPDALPHAEPPGAGHQRLRRRHPEVVAVVLEPLPHLDHVAVALGREEPDPRALALEEGVGGDGGAVDDPLGLAEEGRQVLAQGLGQEGRAPP